MACNLSSAHPDGIGEFADLVRLLRLEGNVDRSASRAKAALSQLS